MPPTDDEDFHILFANSASIHSDTLRNCNDSLSELFSLREDEQLVMTATRVLQHLTGFNCFLCKKKIIVLLSHNHGNGRYKVKSWNVR